MKHCENCGYPNPDNLTNCFKCNSSLEPPKQEPLPETAEQVDTQHTNPAPVAQQAKKPQPAWMTLFQAFVIILFLGGIGICINAGNNEAANITAKTNYMTSLDDEDSAYIDDSDTTHAVRYEVTGSADCVSMTYTNASGGTSQEADMAVPWSESFTAEDGEFLYISAQNKTEYGSVTVTIYVDNVPVETSTSSGAYVIAEAHYLP
jgi:hypothetical protein